jgi:flagellar biosynthesis GTPase FlhF
MKLALSLFLLVVLIAALSSAVAAQDSTSAAQTVETLRAQLLDVQAKENDLQARARQLDEDLKPENIERALAGIGSTRPEELRESRRRQLSIERDSVRAQLKLVSTSRERLESTIRTAEAQAYQQSAQESTQLLNQTLTSHSLLGFRWWVVILAGIDAISVLVLVIVVMRRTKRTV